ncbi:MAG: glycerophosphodiester phosphodiesterase [Cyanobacteria bacterium SZAS LIN-3]|nr:glycerophosphodiester phosphodiesterase [Cyanobacteria bacterium SZAS LIN-3]
MSNTQGVKTLDELFSTHPLRKPAKKGLCTVGPILIGHRGASLDFPENTIPSFARALELGADMLELDVRLSKDGHVVVIHDPTVDRTTYGKGAVSSLTLEELKALTLKTPRDNKPRGSAVAFPAQIATLEEVFQTFPQAIISVEIKDQSWPLCVKVVELIKRFDRFDRTTVELIALKGRLGKKLRQYEPKLSTGHTTGEIIRFASLSRLRVSRVFKKRGLLIEVPLKKGRLKIVTPSFVRAAHKKGIRVFVWTVNDPTLMAKLFKMGVDGIYTDNLGLARTVAEHLRLLGQ